MKHGVFYPQHHVPPRQINIPARHKQRRCSLASVESSCPQQAYFVPEYSVLLLGLDNAGKTTLLEQIKASYTPSHPNLKTVPTVGQNTVTLALPPPNPPIYLKLWDVGGQHSLRGLWQSYYSSCHAIVFVIDSSDVGNATLSDIGEGTAAADDVGRLDECRLVLESILSNEETSGVPILVLANKQDREDCVEVVRIKEGFVRKMF